MPVLLTACVQTLSVYIYMYDMRHANTAAKAQGDYHVNCVSGEFQPTGKNRETLSQGLVVISD